MVVLVEGVVLKIKASFFKSKGVIIIKLPLFIKNEDLIKLVESMAIKMVVIITKIYKSTEWSNEGFQNVIII